MSLKNIIKNIIIKRAAPIGFDEFMDLALYHPQLGYYNSSVVKFGKYGDFTTAPETSNLFGFTLANQCMQLINGDNDILEFGAGSGSLAIQILSALYKLGKLPKRYYILETSAKLKTVQQQTIKTALPEFNKLVVWLDSLPQNFCGVVIANEVLDAMPAKRLIYKKNNFVELGVNYKEGKFMWQVFDNIYKNTNIFLPDKVCVDYITEVNLQATCWVETLFSVVDKGLVLLIDYGMASSEYFHPQRVGGTMQCYYQHKANNNPFINIGKQDITTMVNFSLIANRARSSGFLVAGYATQSMFLIALGIHKYLAIEKNENKRIDMAQQIKQLVLPSIMGESFKVLALSKNMDIKLKGFTEQDLRHKL